MLGTLNGALEVRGISLGSEIRAEVEGVHGVEDGIPVLRRIHVHYRLQVPADAREAVDRALARHADKCPMARTLRGAVEVSWSADIGVAQGAGGAGQGLA